MLAREELRQKEEAEAARQLKENPEGNDENASAQQLNQKKKKKKRGRIVETLLKAAMATMKCPMRRIGIAMTKGHSISPDGSVYCRPAWHHSKSL